MCLLWLQSPTIVVRYRLEAFLCILCRQNSYVVSPSNWTVDATLTQAVWCVKPHSLGRITHSAPYSWKGKIAQKRGALPTTSRLKTITAQKSCQYLCKAERGSGKGQFGEAANCALLCQTFVSKSDATKYRERKEPDQVSLSAEKKWDDRSIVGASPVVIKSRPYERWQLLKNVYSRCTNGDESKTLRTP